MPGANQPGSASNQDFSQRSQDAPTKTVYGLQLAMPTNLFISSLLPVVSFIDVFHTGERCSSLYVLFNLFYSRESHFFKEEAESNCVHLCAQQECVAAHLQELYPAHVHAGVLIGPLTIVNEDIAQALTLIG